MALTVFVQTTISGILLGLVYTAVGVGLSLTMGVLRIVNVSHSAFLIFAAFLTITLVNNWGLDPFLAGALIVPIFAVAGYLVGSTTIRRIAREPATTGLLALFGVMVFLESLAIVIWTTDTRSMATGYLDAALRGFGVSVPLTRLAGAAIAAVAVVALYLFLQRTMTGRSIRAMAQNRDAAALVGIRVDRLDALVFAIGTALAAVGGVALAIVFSLTPQMHVVWLAWAFLVVVVGGLGNVRNTAAAALLLGLVESFAGVLLPFHYTYILVYGLLAAALLFRSEGLFGSKARTI
ncbi:branched-chain amino acid ABC transporter permease [Egibacter rhizosphaerae]|uniref:Branched-chain amino acid ABC transporter permease n=1 Tax=Egibacter rhizosphaerae TaxID=1670831 RepID=A0A411YIC0_9ACTN|nr:branched-chain amino acid ABC transporter permease [Egibacter rhizosphaerae]QBI20891.1 branched-chain amino acid ABC transporter permease [Egibacter rhizosphaerae]